MRSGIAAVLAIFILLMPMSLSASPENQLEPLSFLPLWRPQAQFAGFYVALEKGFYRQNGIDLQFIQGGPNRSPGNYLIDGKADVALLWLSNAIQLAASGADVVNLAQVVQRSALMMVSRKSSGIVSPADMEGKKIAMWPADFQIQPRAFFAKYHLNVQTVTAANTLNLFLRGGVDLALVMWYNEFHTLMTYGIDPDELNTIFFPDYDLNFPEDGIYVLGDTWFKKADLLCRFVMASLEGWYYAFEHPDEALDIVIPVMEKNFVPANRIHQRWMLDRMQNLIDPGRNGTKTFELKESDFQRVSTVLHNDNLIMFSPNFEYFSKGCVHHAKK